MERARTKNTRANDNSTSISYLNLIKSNLGLVLIISLAIFSITLIYAITTEDVIGGVQYSEWTNNKVAVTKNSCSNPENAFLGPGYDAPAFPEESSTARVTPLDFRKLVNTAVPLSLNEPVGFRYSNLKATFLPKTLVQTKGVSPSPR